MRRFVILLLFTLVCGPVMASERSGAIGVPGARLHYVERGAPDSSRTVIFLHGFTDSSFSFAELMPALTQLDPSLRAIAIDQRGHGDSSRPACCYTPQDFARDVVEFMDVRGIRTATIVGHSMGGLIAQLIAIEQPERVSSLVLLGTAPTVDNQGVRDLLTAVKTLSDPVDRKFATEFQASTVHQPLPEAQLAHYVDASMKVPARVWIETLGELIKLDTRPDLGRIRARTLVLWGDRDMVVSREDQQAFVQGIPNATLKVYDAIGHGMHWEAPARVAADLMAFLR